jgi:transposase-like protein
MCTAGDNNTLDDLLRTGCPNVECPSYGKSDSSVAIRGFYGRDNNRVLLYCRTCHHRFSATHGTIFSGKHLSISCQESILRLSLEGKSIRAIAHKLGHDKDTVNRVLKSSDLNSIKTLFDYFTIVSTVVYQQEF